MCVCVCVRAFRSESVTFVNFTKLKLRRKMCNINQSSTSKI